ncbi:hypothetical protein AHY83_004347 [Salmonella enterica subsp. salamae]|nr:hypothetical protein [Salmonella enterica subsp. salamae]
MGINAGIKLFTYVIHHKSPVLTTFIRCLQGTIDGQEIFFLLHNLSSGSPLNVTFCPYAISPDMPYVQQKVVIGLFRPMTS